MLFTNVVWCWLPTRKVRGLPSGNREPTQAEVEFCRKVHLDPLLQQYTSTMKVAVGAPATRSLLGVEAVSKYNGTFNWIEEETG